MVRLVRLVVFIGALFTAHVAAAYPFELIVPKTMTVDVSGQRGSPGSVGFSLVFINGNTQYFMPPLECCGYYRMERGGGTSDNPDITASLYMMLNGIFPVSSNTAFTHPDVSDVLESLIRPDENTALQNIPGLSMGGQLIYPHGYTGTATIDLDFSLGGNDVVRFTTDVTFVDLGNPHTTATMTSAQRVASRYEADYVNVHQVPEPSSMLFLGIGAVIAARFRPGRHA